MKFHIESPQSLYKSFSSSIFSSKIASSLSLLIFLLILLIQYLELLSFLICTLIFSKKQQSYILSKQYLVNPVVCYNFLYLILYHIITNLPTLRPPKAYLLHISVSEGQQKKLNPYTG